MTVRYKVNDEWFTGTVIVQAGKATGKYKTWYNVRGENNEERSIELGTLEWEWIPETETRGPWATGHSPE